MLIAASTTALGFVPLSRTLQSRDVRCSRAAVVCTLDAPLPPATVSVVEARRAVVAEEAATATSIFPTDLLAAQIFGVGKEFTGYKDRAKPNEFTMPAEQDKDLAPAQTDYKEKYGKKASDSIDLSPYFEDDVRR